MVYIIYKTEESQLANKIEVEEKGVWGHLKIPNTRINSNWDCAGRNLREELERPHLREARNGKMGKRKEWVFFFSFYWESELGFLRELIKEREREGERKEGILGLGLGLAY